MSFTAISATVLGSSLYSLVASTSTDASAATTQIPATPSSNAEAAQAKALASDLDALLNALSTGDLNGAQALVAKLKNDIKAQESGVITSPFDSASSPNPSAPDPISTSPGSTNLSSANPSAIPPAPANPAPNSTTAAGSDQVQSLSKLLSKLSDVLHSSGTTAALQVFATFLVQTGQNQGNLVNTNA